MLIIFNDFFNIKFFYLYQVSDGPKSYSNAFCRYVFSRTDQPKCVVIQYIGDSSVAKQFPHGNSKKNERNYIRTQPHVINDIRNASGSSQHVYQSLVTVENPSQPSTSLPRNTEQVRNVLKGVRNRNRLSRDALYNLHEFAYDSDFVHHITTFPDLEIFLYNPEIVNIFRSILVNDNEESPTQQLTYDTTFNLGDFYVSILLFCETEFESSPVLPLAYMLHERKLEVTHDRFFRHMKTLCPELTTSTRVVIITDNEEAISNAIHENFPSLKHFLCWNHILQDCKRWLRAHGISTSAEMSFYTDCVRSLFEATSLQSYKDMLIEFTTKWSQPFVEYFVDHCLKRIDRIGAWELETYEMESATTNQSESFNYVLKRLQDWKEAPVDAMVLSLYRLSQYHVVEINRGRQSLGNYVLRQGLPSSESSVPSSQLVSITELVDNIRYSKAIEVNSDINGQTDTAMDTPVVNVNEPRNQVRTHRFG